jgi:hypothetical protein
MAVAVKMTGVVRFSVLTNGLYSERFPDPADAAAYLFSPERMELRFRLFERVCLPSLARQSDPDFRLVVLTSDQMPRQYLWRLEDLLSPLENTSLVVSEPGAHYQLIREAYDSVPAGDETHAIRFRIDDDDAVDGNYVKRTKAFARSLIQMQGDEAPFVIAYNRGIYLRGRGEEAEIYDACERLPLSIGTAVVVPVSSPLNPYRYNHRKFPQYFNTFTDISAPCFLRTIHGDNKSTPTEAGDTRQWGEKTLRRNLKRHFGLTPEALREI